MEGFNVAYGRGHRLLNFITQTGGGRVNFICGDTQCVNLGLIESRAVKTQCRVAFRFDLIEDAAHGEADIF